MSSNKSASSRPKIVGITGGIGSGKTTVAKMFAEFGAPVYYADAEAKELTATSPEIQQTRSEEHTSELQSRPHLVCRLLLEKKKRLRTRPLRHSHRHLLRNT